MKSFELGKKVNSIELMSLLHISSTTLWRMRKAGKLPPAYRIGNRCYWRLEEVEEYIVSGKCQY